MRITKSKITTPVQEGSRLLQAVGWAVILPQMLAALGGIFAKSGVGQVVSDLVGQVLPTEYPFVAVMAYCLGMMLFTVVMEMHSRVCCYYWRNWLTFNSSNARRKPSNYGTRYVCWILRNTAYANGANFNIVPAMLLELKDKNAVIKAQVPIALSIFIINMFIMYGLVYRF